MLAGQFQASPSSQQRQRTHWPCDLSRKAIASVNSVSRMRKDNKNWGHQELMGEEFSTVKKYTVKSSESKAQES